MSHLVSGVREWESKAAAITRDLKMEPGSQTSAMVLSL